MNRVTAIKVVNMTRPKEEVLIKLLASLSRSALTDAVSSIPEGVLLMLFFVFADPKPQTQTQNQNKP